MAVVDDMPIDTVIEVLLNEAECVRRARYCDKQCHKCDLFMPDNKILSAYATAINDLTIMRACPEMYKG